LNFVSGFVCISQFRRSGSWTNTE